MAERAVIEAFRQHYSGFPKGEIKDSESPDFMVESIGIELIEFQRGTARKFEESCKAICKAVEVRVAQSIVVSQFYVAVHWKSDIEPIRKTEIQSFAGSIIKALCTIPQPFSGNFQLGYKILNQSGLDGHINLISVYSTPNHNIQCYPMLSAWTGLSSIQLNAQITKKEAKVIAYRQAVGSIWLLIYSGTDNLASFATLMPWSERTKPNTAFDKVFYFDVSANKIDELK